MKSKFFASHSPACVQLWPVEATSTICHVEFGPSKYFLYLYYLKLAPPTSMMMMTDDKNGFMCEF